MITSITILSFFIALNVLYLLFIRPRFRKWNSTFKEVNMNMPGDNIINNCRIGSTRGIDIFGKPEDIWQEVIQLKKKRPDIYNYNWIENLLNYKFIKKNKYLRLVQRRISNNRFIIFKPSEATKVYAEQSHKYLILHDTDNRENQYCWIFYLVKERGRSRLLIRSLYRYKPSIFNYMIYEYISEPIYFIMVRRMLRAIKAQVESKT